MTSLIGNLLLTLALICLTAETCLASGDSSRNETRVTVTPAVAGRQLLRMSLPFTEGFVLEDQTLLVSDGKKDEMAALRPLTWHPDRRRPRSVRRGIVTFPYTFVDDDPIQFTLRPTELVGETPPSLPVDVRVDDETVTIVYKDSIRLKALLLAPSRTSSEEPRMEVVESNVNFLWQRFHLPDPQWPRVIEVRSDALGGVVIVAHLQRNEPGHGRAPDFGWEITANSSSNFLRTEEGDAKTNSHSFADGSVCALAIASHFELCALAIASHFEPCELFLEDSGYRLYHPTAPFKRRGQAETRQVVYRYWRCKEGEEVPMQQAAWRRAEIVIAPAGMAMLTPSLEYPHKIQVDAGLWDELYGTGLPMDLKDSPELEKLLAYHHNAIVRSMAHGDDWGNVTSYSDARDTGSIHGMNRLNHCPAIFEEGYRSGDHRLVEVGVLWCDNMYDQSIWWGPEATGGTRYNNIRAWKGGAPDNLYMWRSNRSVNFCTKGYDTFFMAYEQTGDPRMMEALEAQARYAAEHIHSDQGEARNIGDVADFVRLHKFTGEQKYLDEALRLFRELRAKLSTGDLFSQSGRPIVPDPPFIDDDQTGYKHPFAKPYIIGYALAGLPELIQYAPDEPKLRDVAQAVADFLAESQDPIGGWRYPHPRSSSMSLSQAMEHARQIVQADKALGVQEKHLDAIERTLRQRVQGWLRTGQIFSGLSGWEMAAGKVKSRAELYDLYKVPNDRDHTRDYIEGQPGFGGSPPEGLVYFPEVLAFYLKHRPASRLLEHARNDEPLGKVLSRVPDKRAKKKDR